MNRHRERETRPEMSFGEGQRWKEDGNRVTKVKYAGTLVVHWTKPLLRQHRCRRESSGPYGEPEENSLRSYHRSNANRDQIFFTIFFIYIEKKEKKYEEEKDRGKGRRDALYVFSIVRSSRLNIAKGKILFAEKENKKWNSRFFFPLLPISLFTACFSRIFSNFSREIIGKLRIAFTFAIVKYAIKICFVTLRSLLSLNAWMKRSNHVVSFEFEEEKRISPTIRHLRILVLWISLADFNRREEEPTKVQNREQKGGSVKWRIPGRLGAKRK